MTPTALSRATLRSLDPRIAVPGYDPAAVTAGIVHLGLGGFHRAHMARYTHALMNRGGEALGWGIIGAGLLPSDRRVADALNPQDGLYTLVEWQGDEEHVAVIGSIPQVIFAGEDSAALRDAIDRPEIRIVSLTVTEHGYCLNGSDFYMKWVRQKRCGVLRRSRRFEWSKVRSVTGSPASATP